MKPNQCRKVKLGYKRDNLLVDCLAFANDFVILSDSVETTIRQKELRLVYIMTLGLATKFRNYFLFHCVCVNCSDDTELRHCQVSVASNFQETKVVILTF